MATAYKNQRINRSIEVTDLLNGASIATLQQAYPLTEVDFLHIQGRPPVTETWTINLLFVVIGYGLSLGPKMFPWFSGNPSELSKGEVSMFVGGAIVTAVIYGIGICLPNTRRTTMKNIASHFKSAPKSLHVVKGQP